MAKILTYRRWSYALHLFRRWLSNKFSAIKIDLTPVEEKIDEVSEKIDHIDVESADNLAEFFGLPEALPNIEVATEEEMLAVNDEVWKCFYGYGKEQVIMHTLMATGPSTTEDLECKVYVDVSMTWAQNGFPVLYDDEGALIDTSDNPTAGDEVYLYDPTENS